MQIRRSRVRRDGLDGATLRRHLRNTNIISQKKMMFCHLKLCYPL